MKKFVSIMLALAMSMSLAACGADSSSDASSGSQSSSDAASGEKVVKIGVFEPATGDSGAGGKQEMLGMQYANHMTPTVDIGGETLDIPSKRCYFCRKGGSSLRRSRLKIFLLYFAPQFSVYTKFGIDSKNSWIIHIGR